MLDGIDGPIARKLDVRNRIPTLDGNSLDLIIDYFTCTIVPVAFLDRFDIRFPEGVHYEEIRYEGYGIGGAAVIVEGKIVERDHGRPHFPSSILMMPEKSLPRSTAKIWGRSGSLRSVIKVT